MTHDAILREVNQVFVRVFERASIVVTPATTAKDVDGWDSLNHVTLMAALQEHFKVKFSLKEMMRFENVGDVCALLQAKLPP
jgi:acyl carrier protein